MNRVNLPGIDKGRIKNITVYEKGIKKKLTLFDSAGNMKAQRL